MKEPGSISYRAVMAIEYADLLIAIAACVELADELGHDTHLAGKWILDRARTKMTGIWLPNFKHFVYARHTDSRWRKPRRQASVLCTGRSRRQQACADRARGAVATSSRGGVAANLRSICAALG